MMRRLKKHSAAGKLLSKNEQRTTRHDETVRTTRPRNLLYHIKRERSCSAYLSVSLIICGSLSTYSFRFEFVPVYFGRKKLSIGIRLRTVHHSNMSTPVRAVLQNRAIQCSFTSVFHIKNTADTAKAFREAKQVESIFIKAVGAPMAAMGIVGGLTFFFK